MVSVPKQERQLMSIYGVFTRVSGAFACHETLNNIVIRRVEQQAINDHRVLRHTCSMPGLSGLKRGLVSTCSGTNRQPTLGTSCQWCNTARAKCSSVTRDLVAIAADNHNNHQPLAVDVDFIFQIETSNGLSKSAMVRYYVSIQTGYNTRQLLIYIYWFDCTHFASSRLYFIECPRCRHNWKPYSRVCGLKRTFEAKPSCKLPH